MSQLYPLADNQPNAAKRVPQRLSILTEKQKFRFLSKIEEAQEKDGCFLWRGATNNGRGMFGNFPAARVAYAIEHGVDPGFWLVRHACDNPSCVNPQHLFLGTHRDNISDHWAKVRLGIDKPRYPKPYPDYPLTPHSNGQWCKKIKGKLVYFGKLSEPDLALTRFQEYCSKTELAWQPKTVTLEYLLNAFLTVKRNRVATGELTERTYNDYLDFAKRVKRHMEIRVPVSTLGPGDFEALRMRLSATRGPVSLNKDIQLFRIVLKYGCDEGLIQPIRGGQALKPIAKKVLRRLKRTRFFSREEILTLILHASRTFRAMILLGINAGLGNEDVANFHTAKREPGGAVDYPRLKTGAPRRFFLWTETQEALAGISLPFTTTKGNLWAFNEDNPISKAMGKLMDRTGITRNGRNFYTLRHTFQTVADSSPLVKEHTVKFIMGHVDPTMSGVYREWINDEHIQRVMTHVHDWLFK